MKYAYLLLFSVWISNSTIGQANKTSIEFWTEGLEQIEYLEGTDLELEDDFLNEFTSDVFSYFDLEDTYDTPLKKLNFQKTKEYKELSDSLSRRKAELKKNKYIRIDVHDHEHLEYNLTKKGFNFWTNFIDKGFDNAKYKNTIGYLKFNHLSFLFKRQDPYSEVFDQYLFIPVSTEIAEKIEDKNNSTYLYIFFQPASVTTFKHAFSEETDRQIICNGKRLIITVNDEVVYNKEIIPVRSN